MNIAKQLKAFLYRLQCRLLLNRMYDHDEDAIKEKGRAMINAMKRPEGILRSC